MGQFLPDMYDALSIDDFLKNMSDIPKPSLLKLLNPLFILSRPTQNILIDFWNVSIRKRVFGFEIRLYDLKDELTVSPPFSGNSDRWKEFRNLDEGRYSRIRTLYNLFTQNLQYVRAIKFGPPIPDYRKQNDLEEIVEASPIIATQ